MRAIGGDAPDPVNPPAGCRFHPRCPYAVDDCRVGDQPSLLPVDDGRSGHEVSCVYYGPGYDPATLRDGRDGANANVTAETGTADGGDPR